MFSSSDNGVTWTTTGGKNLQFYAYGTVTVPVGNGDGTFQAAQNYRTHLERKSVAVGDLDGDGHPDVVVASFCGSDLKCGGNGTASVFLSNGKGALKPASIYVLGKGPIPTFAPPFVPVGPVMGGDNIAAPGHLMA